MAKLNPQTFADFLIARETAGDGYIMCTVGQNPKDLSEWYFSGQYSGTQLKQARKWREICERVFDCQGLADGYVTEATKTKVNVRARNNFAEWCNIKGSGKIPSKYRIPSAALFVHNGSYVSHVGFLVKPVNASDPDGDWYIIEARGVMYGVKKYKLLSRTSYNRWGLMDEYFDYSEVLQEYHGVKAEEKEEEKVVLGSRLLKRGSKGEDVRLLQELLLKLGYTLGTDGEAKNGVDGDYGPKTESVVKEFQSSHYDLEKDGKYGEETHAALMEAISDLDEEDDVVEDQKKTVRVTAKGTWYVRKGPSKTYGYLTAVNSGSEFPYISTAESGWYQIEINGGSGWISNACSEVVD